MPSRQLLHRGRCHILKCYGNYWELKSALGTLGGVHQSYLLRDKLRLQLKGATRVIDIFYNQEQQELQGKTARCWDLPPRTEH